MNLKELIKWCKEIAESDYPNYGHVSKSKKIHAEIAKQLIALDDLREAVRHDADERVAKIAEKERNGYERDWHNKPMKTKGIFTRESAEAALQEKGGER